MYLSWVMRIKNYLSHPPTHRKFSTQTLSNLDIVQVRVTWILSVLTPPPFHLPTEIY